MSALKSLTCPTCGAPITVTGDTAEVQCSFCGNNVVVPLELMRQKPDAALPQPPVIVVQQPMISPSYGTNYGFGRPTRRRSSGCGAIVSFVIFFALAAGAAILRARPDLLTNAINRAIPNSAVQSTSVPFPTTLAIPTMIPFPTFSGDVSIASATAPEISGAAVNTTPAIGASATPAMLSFGGEGTGAGLFTDPRFIAVDPQGNSYVTDYKTGRVQRFDHEGHYTVGWQIDRGSSSVGPFCVATDRSGNVYICQFSTIYKFTGATGALITKFGGNSGVEDLFRGLAVRLDGTMVAYSYHNEDDLVFMDAKGRITKRLTNFASSQIGSAVISADLAVDGLGNVYFLDENSGYVLLFGPDGKYVNRFGGVGDKPGMFNAAAAGLAVDGKSNVYVGDFRGIEVLDAQGHFQSTLKLPIGVARSFTINDRNELYALVDKTIYRLKTPAGT